MSAELLPLQRAASAFVVDVTSSQRTWQELSEAERAASVEDAATVWHVASQTTARKNGVPQPGELL